MYLLIGQDSDCLSGYQMPHPANCQETLLQHVKQWRKNHPCSLLYGSKWPPNTELKKHKPSGLRVLIWKKKKRHVHRDGLTTHRAPEDTSGAVKAELSSTRMRPGSRQLVTRSERFTQAHIHPPRARTR